MKLSMANKPAYSSSGMRSERGQRLLSLAFIIFLFVTFVGLTPFTEHTELEDLAETGESDIVRQLVFISLTLLISYLFFRRKNNLRTFLRLITGPILVVLAWCSITLLWSAVPLIGLKRLGLTTIIIFTVFASVKGLGAWKCIRLLAMSLTIFVLASLVSGPFIPGAQHLAGERDLSLVGAWRGIFEHKNQAGAYAALCVIGGYFFWRIERRSIWLIAIIGGIALLILSKSKTSLLVIIPAILIGIFYKNYSVMRGKAKYLLRTIIFSAYFMVISIFIIFYTEISEVFDDPDGFTGRVQIWNVLFLLINESPLAGYGFASIYLVGSETPLLNYASGWVALRPSGHNGYLDVAVSTGLIGLFLTVFTFIARPIYQIINYRTQSSELSGLLLAWIFFITSNNFFESSILNRDKGLWVALLIICATAQNLKPRVDHKI